ncbi:hypothetical protein B5X24_HaOG213755 [Helicoverpa armigera]|uniref:Endonuclease/exonuclease/phosphatase domain-containing protein n=1 Tax=Helicoverpa armigera TaxID=29058 RepID=A0A2W1BHU6_HELAM|nr:hypothetical protein B5X24_HaOG213755 [Helicoverpa armigera]
MRSTETRPPVPGSSAIPGAGSGQGTGGAGGAKNLRKRSGYPPPRRLALVTHNIRILRPEEKICELEEELSKLHWDIIGLCEVRREGEDTVTLKSGNLLYYREGDQKSQGGVGFFVHKSLVNNITTINSVSNRVIYLILRISERYSLKVIQVYAPTSSHSDDEVETMYEDVGKKSCDELRVGQFGYEQRNPRGQRLADFLEKEELFMMNSFFQKPPHRKWTWLSPDGFTRNEIDFFMTDKKRIFSDVSVINRVKTGSDHRIVRASLNINVKLERSSLMKSTLRPTRSHIQNPESFQLKLSNRFACLENLVSVDEINDGLVETVRTVGSKFFRPCRKDRPQKLTEQTLNLMAERRLLQLQSSHDAKSYRQLNRRISKSLRHDLRLFNTNRVKETIQQNQGSKVSTQIMYGWYHTLFIKERPYI